MTSLECILGILERVRGLEVQKKALGLQQSEIDREINEQKNNLNDFLDAHFMDVKVVSE